MKHGRREERGRSANHARTLRGIQGIETSTIRVGKQMRRRRTTGTNLLYTERVLRTSARSNWCTLKIDEMEYSNKRDIETTPALVLPSHKTRPSSPSHNSPHPIPIHNPKHQSFPIAQLSSLFLLTPITSFPIPSKLSLFISTSEPSLMSSSRIFLLTGGIIFVAIEP